MDTKITFDGTHTPAPAQCGCELRGSTAVLLCPLHAAAPDLLAAANRLAEWGLLDKYDCGLCCWSFYDHGDNIHDCPLTDTIAAIAKAKG